HGLPPDRRELERPERDRDRRVRDELVGRAIDDVGAQPNGRILGERDQRSYERDTILERREEGAAKDGPREERAATRHGRPRERTAVARTRVLRVPHVVTAGVAARDHELAARRTGEEWRGQWIVDVGKRE